MFSWVCSKCGITVRNCKTCKCGNTYKDISAVLIYAEEGIESLNIPIGSHTEATIDGKSFEVIVNKYTYQKEPQRNEDFRVPKEEENA